jgi:hypothetical protein
VSRQGRPPQDPSTQRSDAGVLAGYAGRGHSFVHGRVAVEPLTTTRKPRTAIQLRTQ